MNNYHYWISLSSQQRESLLYTSATVLPKVFIFLILASNANIFITSLKHATSSNSSSSRSLLFVFKTHLEVLQFLVFHESRNTNLWNDRFHYLDCLQLSVYFLKL